MISAEMEDSHSGRVRRLGKAVRGKPLRGFESLILRTHFKAGPGVRFLQWEDGIRRGCQLF